MREPLFTRLAFALLWLFVFSMPSEKSIEIPGLGTISKAMGAVAMAGAVLAIATRGRVRLPRLAHGLACLFVLWSAVTMRWSMMPDYTSERIITFAQLLAVFCLIWELCPSEGHCLSLMEAYVFGSLVPAVVTLQRFLAGRDTYYQRYATTGFDPNDLALTLAIGIPMAYYLSLRRTGLRCWMHRLAMVCAAGTILLTASRGGTLAMALGFGLVAWTLPSLGKRQRAATLALMAVLAAGAAMVVPATSWKRLATLASEVREGTLNSRTTLWSSGLRAFADSPLEGVGAGAYPETTLAAVGRPWGFLPVAHNTFLSILVETGLIGFGIFAAFLSALGDGIRRMSGNDRKFWLTLMAVWSLGVFSLTWEYRKPTWLLFALAAAHAAAIVNRPRAEEARA